MPSVGDIIHRNQEVAIASFFMFFLNCILFVLLDLPSKSSKSLNITEESLINTTDSLVLITDTEIGNLILNQELSRCLSEHSKFNFLPVLEAQNYIHDDESKVLNTAKNASQVPCTPSTPHGLCLHSLLVHFSECMASLNVTLRFVEPSVLFCLLPSARRFNLLTRGFKPGRLSGSRNVLAFGISEEDAEIFDSASGRLEIIKSGFRIWRYPKLSNLSSRNLLPLETLHYTVTKSNVIMHLVVFYKRFSYLWHPGLNASHLPSSRLLFKEDGAFDSFDTRPLDLDTSTSVQIPSDSRTFLLATESSKFVECKEAMAATSVNESAKNNVLESLREIKEVFGLYMVKFWLWSKTLLGWYRSCNVLQYSPDLELSIALKTLEGYNFSALFANTTCQSVEQVSSSSLGSEMKCNGLNVKLSLMHEEKNISWYAYSDGQNTFRHTFSELEICSGDVWGLKINVPCDITGTLELEL